jgi:EmrB/QacA subfamily drug resistance transporter
MLMTQATEIIKPNVTDHRTGRALALTVLLVGAFLPPLDYFIVNLALPAIQTGLHATGAQLQLVISSYASAYAVFLITGGRLGDIFGRKRMFMIGLTGFVLASALCGFAPNGNVLIAGRLLQGASAAVMAPQVLATIRTMFSAGEQTRVMGYYGSVFGMASIVGQLGGGILITLRPFGLDWESIFLINVPIGILALVGAAKLLPESRSEQRTRIDLLGVALLSTFLGLVIYPLTRGREAGWPPWTFVALFLSLPALFLFVIAEKRIAKRGGDPLVDFRLFKSGSFVIGLTITFLFYCISVFFLTYGIYLQNGFGWNVLACGVAIMPFAVGFFFGPFISHEFARRVHANVLAAGFILMTIGYVLIVAQLHFGDGPGPIFYAGLFFAGVGQGFVFPSLVRIVLAEVEPEKAGLAAGMVTSTLQIGAAVGVAAIGGLFFTVLGGHSTATAYSQAFETVLVVVVLLLLCCTALAKLLNRH